MLALTAAFDGVTLILLQLFGNLLDIDPRLRQVHLGFDAALALAARKDIDGGFRDVVDVGLDNFVDL